MSLSCKSSKWKKKVCKPVEELCKISLDVFDLLVHRFSTRRLQKERVSEGLLAQSFQILSRLKCQMKKAPNPKKTIPIYLRSHD